MDDKEFKARASRLQHIGKVLEKLPTEIRESAFELLKEYVETKKAPSKSKLEPGNDSREAFFEAFTHDKPADNARLIAAYFYREYGGDSFSLDEVRQTSDDVGITIPERIDMTFLQAKEKGKKLFARAGTGKFKPTVHGESYLKSTYSVKKGTKKRAQGTE